MGCRGRSPSIRDASCGRLESSSQKRSGWRPPSRRSYEGDRIRVGGCSARLVHRLSVERRGGAQGANTPPPVLTGWESLRRACSTIHASPWSGCEIKPDFDAPAHRCHDPRGSSFSFAGRGPGAGPAGVAVVRRGDSDQAGLAQEPPAGRLLRVPRRDVGTLYETRAEMTSRRGSPVASKGVTQTGHHSSAIQRRPSRYATATASTREWTPSRRKMLRT